MAIDKALYKDKRLTESEKKNIKPANQGGGPNYLGKQETVTVPKKWLSDPDHVVAELAYITPREQKILLDANLYGSLKGKPNRGPGGIMSLQGDLGGFSTSTGGKSGDSSGKGGGGSTSYKDTNYYEMMTGQKNIGQTVKTGPKTRRYAVPEYGNVLQPDGTYKRTYIGSGYKSYGTPSFFGNLFSRGAPGYRGIKGMPPLGNSNANLELRDGPLGMGYYSDKENFAEIRNQVPLGIMGIIGNILSKFKKPPVDYSDMSKYNRLGLFGVDPTLTDNYSDMKISNTSFSPNVNIPTIPDFINPPGQINDTGIEYSVPSANPEDYDFFSNAMADVTQQDIDASKSRGFNMMDYDTARTTGLISPNVTPYEFEQLKQGNITKPGTYVG